MCTLSKEMILSNGNNGNVPGSLREGNQHRLRSHLLLGQPVPSRGSVTMERGEMGARSDWGIDVGHPGCRRQSGLKVRLGDMENSGCQVEKSGLSVPEVH